MHTYVDVDRVEAGVIVFMRIQHGLPMLKKVLIMVHFSLSLSLSGMVGPGVWAESGEPACRCSLQQDDTVWIQERWSVRHVVAVPVIHVKQHFTSSHSWLATHNSCQNKWTNNTHKWQIYICYVRASQHCNPSSSMWSASRSETKQQD